jgi:hypothetical protein
MYFISNENVRKLSRWVQNFYYFFFIRDNNHFLAAEP